MSIAVVVDENIYLIVFPVFVGTVVNVGDNATGDVVDSVSGGNIVNIPNFGGEKL